MGHCSSVPGVWLSCLAVFSFCLFLRDLGSFPRNRLASKIKSHLVDDLASETDKQNKSQNKN